jgi:hypothetical protein
VATAPWPVAAGAGAAEYVERAAPAPLSGGKERKLSDDELGRPVVDPAGLIVDEAPPVVLPSSPAPSVVEEPLPSPAGAGRYEREEAGSEAAGGAEDVDEGTDESGGVEVADGEEAGVTEVEEMGGLRVSSVCAEQSGPRRAVRVSQQTHGGDAGVCDVEETLDELAVEVGDASLV